MFFLWNFTLYPNKMAHVRSPSRSHPATAPSLPNTSAKRPVRCCRETLAKGDHHPSLSHQSRHNLSHYSSSPSCCFPLMLCSSLLLRLAHFGDSGTNHCHPTSTLCPLSVTGPFGRLHLYPSLCLTFPENLSTLICKQSCIYSPLVIISQVSTGTTGEQ